MLEHPRRGKRRLFPMRVVALAAPMQHQVEAGDNAEAITGEGAEPSHFRDRDGKAGGFGVGLDDFVGVISEQRADALRAGGDDQLAGSEKKQTQPRSSRVGPTIEISQSISATTRS